MTLYMVYIIVSSMQKNNNYISANKKQHFLYWRIKPQSAKTYHSAITDSLVTAMQVLDEQRGDTS